MPEDHNHTPGPWRVHSLLPDCCDIVSANGEWIGEVSDKNATLIVMAPRLLKELKHLLRFFGPLENEGALPAGLATLNGAREVIALVEDKTI